MKTIRGLFFFILGAFIGFLSLLCFDKDRSRIFIYKLLLKDADLPLIKLDKYGWLANLCLLIIVLVAGLLITYIIRFFMDSLCVEKCKSILKFCITVIVALLIACPVTRFLAYAVTIFFMVSPFPYRLGVDKPLNTKQFYRIVEMNWNNTKDVEHWNYYRTGEIVTIPEEEFFNKLYLAEYAKDINWFD
ncbi:MAG: hypothetical protein K6E28_09910 [Eubacterium sp.]|nr:hypothetical protein [Eubacterium sp.]